MSVTITQVADNGDGTSTVTAVSPGRHYVSVQVGHDVIASGDVYKMLDIAASKADSKSASIAAHDDANSREA